VIVRRFCLPVVAALLAVHAAGCAPATFVPQGARQVESQGTAARIERARLVPGGGMSLSSRLEVAGGARVRDARLVAAREPGCGQGGVLAHAGEIRLGDTARWQRPLPVANGDTLVLAFSDYQRAFSTPSLLELELDASGGPTCLRVPLAGSDAALAWRPQSPAAVAGLRFLIDGQSLSAQARAGVTIARYRHVIEFGLSTGPEGALLANRTSLALGLTSERLLWNPRSLGLLAGSAELSYQVRFAFDAAPDRPRLIHGPRIGIRPLMFILPSPPLLESGLQFGSLSVMELFFSYWMAADGAGRSATLGLAITWDRPVFN
jgi:hypothetical protein